MATFATGWLAADTRTRLAASQTPSEPAASHPRGNLLGERAQFLFDGDASAAPGSGPASEPSSSAKADFSASQSSGGEVWFPAVTRRPRRNRRSESLRALVRESEEMRDPR